MSHLQHPTWPLHEATDVAAMANRPGRDAGEPGRALGRAGQEDEAPQHRLRLPSRPPIIALCLLGCWVVVALLLGDGYLSPDTGAKIASLDTMVRRGDLSPDLGWWAEELDPDGSLHPYMGVQRFGDDFVAVTTLPMLYLARPLYALGGHHAALLVPMLGGVLTAFAAGALARRLGGGRSAATTAVWVTGLAGPVAVYSLSFWEHTLGLALMAWGVVWALDAVRDPVTWRAALYSGMAYGAAATMRQEALVYGAVAGLVVVGSAFAGHRLARAVRTALAMAVGLSLPVLVNLAVESAVLGSSMRSGRSAGTLAAAGSHVGARVEAALVTFAAPISSGDVLGLVLAVCLLIALPSAIRAAIEGRRALAPVAALAAVVALSAMFQLAVGPAFVPGLIAASPLAAAGLVVVATRRTWQRRPVVAAAALALGPLPLVWAVQFATEGAWPQWGGRYILLTGLVLTVIAVVELADAPRPVVPALIAANLVVTAVGVATVVVRSHEYADLAQQLEARPEEVLLFHDGFLVQEAGTAALEHRWLRASTEQERLEAADVLVRLGADTVGYLGPDDGTGPEPHLPGYTPVRRSWVGQEGGRRIQVTTYQAVGG